MIITFLYSFNEIIRNKYGIICIIGDKMESRLILPNLNFSRTITEKFLDDDNPHFGQDAFYMFSVSKFILLKERIIKKDTVNNILYFDNNKFKGYIPIILEFYKQILESGDYKKNNTIVELTDKSVELNSLEDAIWCFNKVRDSLAHGKYGFNFRHKCITIDNVAEDNSYLLKCEIPIDLLNSFTFFGEENIDKLDKENLKELYKTYIKKMSRNFEFDNNVYYNPYIYNYISYNDYIIKNKNIINDYIIDNGKINNDTYNYSNINNDLIITTKHEYAKNNNSYKKLEKDLVIDKEIDFFLNQEIDKLSIEELCKLSKLLLLVKPKNQKEKEQIIVLLKQFKILLSQYNVEKENKEFNKKTEELICEMQKILGIKNECKNPNGIISLYSYMSLVFSQIEEIDYSKLKIHSMLISFTPKNKIEGTAINYFNTIESIKRKCTEFNLKIESHIFNYGNNRSQKYRHSLMDSFAKFYTEIMGTMGTKNKFVIDSVRNAVEHGNYKYHKKGYIVMYDQTDHNDDETIKFVAAVNPKTLFNISKQIESSKNDEFLLRDFVQQLSPIIGNELFERTWNNLKQLSNIIFGKELNLDYTMENMYHEVFATIISSGIKRQ